MVTQFAVTYLVELGLVGFITVLDPAWFALEFCAKLLLKILDEED